MKRQNHQRSRRSGSKIKRNDNLNRKKGPFDSGNLFVSNSGNPRVQLVGTSCIGPTKRTRKIAGSYCPSTEGSKRWPHRGIYTIVGIKWDIEVSYRVAIGAKVRWIVIWGQIHAVCKGEQSGHVYEAGTRSSRLEYLRPSWQSFKTYLGNKTRRKYCSGHLMWTNSAKLSFNLRC